MYSDEELEEIDKRIREASKKEDERIEKFWKDEYVHLSAEDKAKYWSGYLFRSMREQEGSGLNVYAIYTKYWLKSVLEKEPNFIQLLPLIYNIWGGLFDATKVDRIIQKLLKDIG